MIGRRELITKGQGEFVGSEEVLMEMFPVLFIVVVCTAVYLVKIYGRVTHRVHFTVYKLYLG